MDNADCRAITDTQNANLVQSFGYDALDRLTSASANAGSGSAVGQYSDTYAYDALGSPTNMDGRAYDYAGSGHAHAVRYASVLGSGKFNNFTSSAAGWYVCPTYCALTTDGGEGVLRNGPSSGGSYTEVYSNGYSLTAGQSFQIEFKASRDGNPPDMVLGLEAGDGDQRFAIIATPGQNLRVQRKVWNSRIGTTWSYSQFAPAYTLENGTWYVLRLSVGDTGANKFKVSLWKRDDPSVRRTYELTTTPNEWSSQSWRVHNWVAKVGENNKVLLDSYMELLTASNGVWSYRYDDNGNMIARVEEGIAYAQTWDAQNRLIQVTYGSILTPTNSTYSFAYDADGGRVLQVAPGSYKTAYIGAYEEAVTPTALFTQDFEGGTGNWTITGGTWNRYYSVPDTYYYKQSTWEAGESSAVIAPAVTYGEITATARVRLDLGTNVLAGLVLRRNTSNNPAYFVGIRNSASGYYCGIYEKSSGTWTVHTGQLTTCKYATGGWHTLLARAAGGRIEMYVDNTLIATWVDTDGTLPAYGFGLMTFDGAASFDNVKVYGLTTRSYYAFGAARVAERTTSHLQAAGSGAAPGGGWVYYLAADHLGSTSLALTTSGVVTGTRAYYMSFGAERGPAASLPTDFTYTGGRGSSFGLVHLGARWYDSRLMRWTAADTIVPNAANPQDYDRFGYAGNRPLKYTDPSGHCAVEDESGSCGQYSTPFELVDYYTAWFKNVYGITVIGRRGWDSGQLIDIARAFNRFPDSENRVGLGAKTVAVTRIGQRALNSDEAARFEHDSHTIWIGKLSPRETSRQMFNLGVTRDTLMTLLTTHEIVHAWQSTYVPEPSSPLPDPDAESRTHAQGGDPLEDTSIVQDLRTYVGITSLDASAVHGQFKSLIPIGTYTRATRDGAEAMAIAVSVNMYAHSAWVTSPVFPRPNLLQQWADENGFAAP